MKFWRRTKEKSAETTGDPMLDYLLEWGMGGKTWYEPLPLSREETIRVCLGPEYLPTAMSADSRPHVPPGWRRRREKEGLPLLPHPSAEGGPSRPSPASASLQQSPAPRHGQRLRSSQKSSASNV